PLCASVPWHADYVLLTIHQGRLKTDRQSSITLSDCGDQPIAVVLAGVIDDAAKSADLNALSLETSDLAGIGRCHHEAKRREGDIFAHRCSPLVMFAELHLVFRRHVLNRF